MISCVCCCLFTEVRTDLDLLLGLDIAAQQRSAGLFLLKLKEHRRLSQAAIDDIVQEWNGLFSHTLQRLNARVSEKLASSGIDVDSIEGLQEVFQDFPSPFQGLETRYFQEKYFRESLGLLVSIYMQHNLCKFDLSPITTLHIQEPVEINIGDPYYDSVFTGAKRRLVEKQDSYQYVPLLSSLRSLLSDPSVMDQVEQCQHYLGDNLGSNAIGGFKESFSFSFRFCRTCYVTTDTYKTISNSSELTLRSDEKHRQECLQLNGPTYEHYSKIYGINRRSILLDIPHFSIFKGGLACDIMHDVLEGVIPLEMSLLLHHYIVTKKYFSLDDYNYRLAHFDYDYTETSKPPPITSRSVLIDRKQLKLSASQSLLLLRIFPFLVGDLIPCECPNWQCFM